ncbi:MAG: hypothetical protein HUJ61_08185 [Bacilli bacterium]|nr:hypothetical protein [Bacilli bacterium]
MNKKLKTSLMLVVYLLTLSLSLIGLLSNVKQESRTTEYTFKENTDAYIGNLNAFEVEKRTLKDYTSFIASIYSTDTFLKNISLDTITIVDTNVMITSGTVIGTSSGTDVAIDENIFVYKIVKLEDKYTLTYYVCGKMMINCLLSSSYLNNINELRSKRIEFVQYSRNLGKLNFEYLDYSYGIVNGLIKVIFSFDNNEQFILEGSGNIHIVNTVYQDAYVIPAYAFETEYTLDVYVNNDFVNKHMVYVKYTDYEYAVIQSSTITFEEGMILWASKY